MIKINSNKFGFNFFLSDRKKVNSLEAGAKTYGGATRYNNGIYSNIPGNDFIKVNGSHNTLSIFIPSTVNTDEKTDNSDMIQYSLDYLEKYYDNNDIISYATNGSWYSDDKQVTVIEDITIMSVDMETVTEKDIDIFKELALYIKQAMNQEGVSITINTALAIV